MQKGLTWLLALLLMLLPAASLSESVDNTPVAGEGTSQVTLLYRETDAGDIQARAWGGMLAMTLGGKATAVLVPGAADAAAFGEDLQASIFDALRISIHISGEAGLAVVNQTIETTTVMENAVLCVLGYSTMGQVDAMGNGVLLVAGKDTSAADGDWSRTGLASVFAADSLAGWMAEAYPLRNAADYEIPTAAASEGLSNAAAEWEADLLTEERMAQSAQGAANQAIARVTNLSALNAAQVMLYGAVDVRTVWLRNQSALFADTADAESDLVLFGLSMQHTAEATLFGIAVEKATIGGTARLYVLADAQVQRIFATEQASVSLGAEASVATIFHRDSASIYGAPEDQRIIVQFHTN